MADLTDQNESGMTPNIVTLTDENGQEHEFDQLDYLQTEKGEYVALTQHVETAEEIENYDGQLLILKVVAQGGEEMLYFIEDDDEFNEIAAQFMDRLGDEFDFEDDGETGEEVEMIE